MCGVHTYFYCWGEKYEKLCRMEADHIHLLVCTREFELYLLTSVGSHWISQQGV